MGKKIVLVTGGTGLIGKHLVVKLLELGYTVRVLTRDKNRLLSRSSLPIEAFEWSVGKGYLEDGALEGLDIVVNLAGEGIADGRWTEEKKKRIYDSRVVGTKLLISSLKSRGIKPEKFISGSAIGIYGDRGDDELEESSSFGGDFLAKVCRDWEEAALNQIEGVQTFCLRTGVVLAKEGGALGKMLPAFKMGVGGPIGTGNQYMSWIHIDDLVGQIIFLVEKGGQEVIYNAVAPWPVTNKEFSKALGMSLGRPSFFSVPKFVLGITLGEVSEILLASQRVRPKNFLAEGFSFEYTSLDKALGSILGKS